MRLALLILASTSTGVLPTSAAAQVEQNTSLNGIRLTYYPGPDANQCFADCASNSTCQGVTWIQAGTYKPRDAAMCYLLSTVTGRVAARGHVSVIKMQSPPVAPRPPPAVVRPAPQQPPIQRPPVRADPLDQVDIERL